MALDVSLGAARRSRLPRLSVLRRLVRPRFEGLGLGGWISLSFLVFVLVLAVLAPVLPLANPNTVSATIGASPSAVHWLGTNELGQDELARLIYGARISLLVGASTALIGLIAGTAIGLISGYYRSWLDRFVVIALDTTLAFPGIVLILALAAAVGSTLSNVILILGISFVPIFARLARTSTLSLSEEGYVLAARSLGVRTRRLLVREILPGVLRTTTTYALIMVGVAIVLQGALSFLGISVGQDTPTWGGMIASSETVINQAPQVALFPSIALFLTVLAINVIGDRMRSRVGQGVQTL